MTFSRSEILDQLSGTDRKQLLDPGFVALILEDTRSIERKDIVRDCQQRARELRCLTDFNALLKNHLREMNQRLEIVADNSYLFEQAGEDPITFQTGIWIVDSRGVRSQGKKAQVASLYPVVISKRLVNVETTEERLVLTWLKDGALKSITARRDVVASRSKIVELSLFGFPVNSETARALILFLADFESLNSDLIPVEKSTSKFGWHGNDFVPFTDLIRFDSESSQRSLVESIHSVGSFEDWLKLVREIRASGRQEPLISLAAAFASVLVSVVKISPFIVNLFGRTGSGKTVCLMLGASVWGDPSGRGLISESNSTGNALEMRLNTLNHLPLLIDDLSKSNNEERLTDLVYLLCAGGGKGRLDRNTRARQTSTWGNTILTNLERPLARDQMRAGAINRILDFSVQEGDIFDDPNRVVSGLSSNFGYAGEMFVRQIQAEGFESVRSLVKKYERRITECAGDIKLEQKQIIPASLLLASDQIAESAIFRDGVRLDLPFVVSALKASDQVSECERAYRFVFDQIAIHSRNFSDSDDFAEAWGKDDGQTVAIIDSKLSDFARVGNFDKRQFLSWCESKGLLITGDGRHRQKKITLPGTGRQVRCWVIRSGFGESESETEPLPF